MQVGSLLPLAFLLCTAFVRHVNQDIYCDMVTMLLLLLLSHRTRSQQRRELGRSIEGNLSIASAISADESTRRPSKSAMRSSSSSARPADSRIPTHHSGNKMRKLRQRFHMYSGGVFGNFFTNQPPLATTANTEQRKKLAQKAHPTHHHRSLLLSLCFFFSFLPLASHGIRTTSWCA